MKHTLRDALETWNTSDLKEEAREAMGIFWTRQDFLDELINLDWFLDEQDEIISLAFPEDTP
jgi:hypothetical protein